MPLDGPPGGSLPEMAVLARETGETLYRAVSPWELADILKTGAVVGKGAYFSGDLRRTAGRVWFGNTLKGVAHHGTDWRRYLESTDTFRRAFRVKEAIYKYSRESYSTDARIKAERLFGQFQDALFGRLGKMMTKLLQLQKKQPAGYVIQVEGVPGGTRYTGADSLAGRGHGEEERPDEIAMPPGKITPEHITKVHAMSMDGNIIQTWDKPAGGWQPSVFRLPRKRTDDFAPDVSKDLAAMDKQTEAYALKLDAIRRQARESVQLDGPPGGGALREGREGTFKLNPRGMPYGFELDLMFRRADGKPFDAARGTPGFLGGRIAYWGGENPENFLDLDEEDELLELASKTARAPLRWVEGTWVRGSRSGVWTRSVHSSRTTLEGLHRGASTGASLSAWLCEATPESERAALLKFLTSVSKGVWWGASVVPVRMWRSGRETFFAVQEHPSSDSVSLRVGAGEQEIQRVADALLHEGVVSEADERLRELERQAATGDDDAKRALVIHLGRLGKKLPEHIWLQDGVKLAAAQLRAAVTHLDAARTRAAELARSPAGQQTGTYDWWRSSAERFIKVARGMAGRLDRWKLPVVGVREPGRFREPLRTAVRNHPPEALIDASDTVSRAASTMRSLASALEGRPMRMPKAADALYAVAGRIQRLQGSISSVADPHGGYHDNPNVGDALPTPTLQLEGSLVLVAPPGELVETDARTRELERRAATGDYEAAIRLAMVRMRGQRQDPATQWLLDSYGQADYAMGIQRDYLPTVGVLAQRSENTQRETIFQAADRIAVRLGLPSMGGGTHAGRTDRIYVTPTKGSVLVGIRSGHTADQRYPELADAMKQELSHTPFVMRVSIDPRTGQLQVALDKRHIQAVRGAHEKYVSILKIMQGKGEGESPPEGVAPAERWRDAKPQVSRAMNALLRGPEKSLVSVEGRLTDTGRWVELNVGTSNRNSRNFASLYLPNHKAQAAGKRPLVVWDPWEFDQEEDGLRMAQAIAKTLARALGQPVEARRANSTYVQTFE